MACSTGLSKRFAKIAYPVITTAEMMNGPRSPNTRAAMPPKSAPNGTIPQVMVRETAFILPSMRVGVICCRSVVFSAIHQPEPMPKTRCITIAKIGSHATAKPMVAMAQAHSETWSVRVFPSFFVILSQKKRLITVPEAAPTDKAVKVILFPPSKSSLYNTSSELAAK